MPARGNWSRRWWGPKQEPPVLRLSAKRAGAVVAMTAVVACSEVVDFVIHNHGMHAQPFTNKEGSKYGSEHNHRAQGCLVLFSVTRASWRSILTTL